MKVLLIDIDSKIPNLALKKIEKYHRDKNDEIIWNNELFANNVDKIYASCVFDWNKNKAKEFEKYSIALIGGSGYDIAKTLPSEIDMIKPRINIGFATRGCIRKCPFCIVWKKEPELKIESDVYDIWNGEHFSIDKNGKKCRTLITFLDNNILALFDHFKLICSQLKKEKLVADFNQGLDHRLLNQDTIDLMKDISHKEYRFAFDHPSYISTVEKAIDLLQKNKINRCFWYVLVGFNTTLTEDFQRLNYLRSRKQNAYVQRYSTCTGKRDYILMASWVNQQHIFYTHTFEEFKRKKLKEYARQGENENVDS